MGVGRGLVPAKIPSPGGKGDREAVEEECGRQINEKEKPKASTGLSLPTWSRSGRCTANRIFARIPLQSASLTASPREKLLVLDWEMF